jgi:hypothetical protein
MKDRRTSITVPVVLDNEIQKYMEQTGIKTWNAALWELVRAGLEAKKTAQK